MKILLYFYQKKTLNKAIERDASTAVARSLLRKSHRPSLPTLEKEKKYMKMISYWTEAKEIHVDSGLVLIIGKYNHKNQNEHGEKCLGIHWGDYPQSRGILSPCVIPASTRNAILSGLLYNAVTKKDSKQVELLTEAIGYFD